MHKISSYNLVNLFKGLCCACNIDKIILIVVDAMLVIIALLETVTFCIIPYRDMMIGIYPASRIVSLFLSPWTPENFGMLSTFSPSHLYIYLLELLLPPVKAFVIYSITPYIVTSVVAYYALEKLINIRNKSLLLLFTLLYTYNWFTLYLYGSALVIYAYAGGLLLLSSLYKSQVCGFTVQRLIEIVLALFLALFSWNLVGFVLVLFLTIPILMSYTLTLSFKELRKLLIALIKSVIVAMLLFMPFIYTKVIGVLSEGILGHALEAGYISSANSWLKILMPYYFEKYLGNFLKLLSIFIDPALSSLQSIIIVALLLMVISIYLIKIKKYGVSGKFFISNILYIIIIYFLVMNIINEKSIINVIYSRIAVVAVLRTVTNFITILAPSLFIVYVISIREVRNKILKYFVILGIIFVIIHSYWGVIYGIHSLNHYNKLSIGSTEYNVIRIPRSIVHVFDEINTKRKWSFRALWLPLYPEERSAFTSVPEDLPISKTTDKQLAKYYDMLLRALLSREDNNISKYLLQLFGVRYIILLKNINDSAYPSVTYFGYTPVGVKGNYSIIEKALSTKTFLKLINDSKYFSIYTYNKNITYFESIRIVRNYTIFNILKRNITVGACNVKIYNGSTSYKVLILHNIMCKKYRSYYFMKITPMHGIYLKLNKETIQMLKDAPQLIIDLSLIYQGNGGSLYGNIINIGGTIRILIKPNGQLLVQYYTPRGYINQLSRTKLLLGQIYNIVIVINKSRCSLYIDGILDSTVHINQKLISRNNNLIIGSDNTYAYKGYIGNIYIIMDMSKEYNIDKYINNRIYNIYFNYIINNNDNVNSKCLNPYSCVIYISSKVNNSRVHYIVTSLQLNDYWRVRSFGCSLSKIYQFDGFSIIKLSGCNSREIVVYLDIDKKLIIEKYLSIIASILAIIYLVKNMRRGK